jgi:hypothetical protein
MGEYGECYLHTTKVIEKNGQYFFMITKKQSYSLITGGVLLIAAIFIAYAYIDDGFHHDEKTQHNGTNPNVTSGHRGDSSKQPSSPPRHNKGDIALQNPLVNSMADEVKELYYKDHNSLRKHLESEKYKYNAILIGRVLIADDSIDIEHLMHAFSNLNDFPTACNLSGELAEKIVHQDVRKALEFADLVNPGALRDSIISSISRNIGVENWGTILKYASDTGLVEDKRSIYSALSQRIGKLDKTQLAVLVDQNNIPAEIYGKINVEFGKRLCENIDPDAALAQLNKYPASTADNIKRGILSSAASTPGNETWVIKQLQNENQWSIFEKAQFSINSGTLKMNNEEPSKVMEWALGISDTKLADATASGVFQSWFQRDSIKSSAWAATLPSGSGKDAVVTTLIANLVQLGDHVNASKWLPQITSPDAQSNAKRILSRRY